MVVGHGDACRCVVALEDDPLVQAVAGIGFGGEDDGFAFGGHGGPSAEAAVGGRHRADGVGVDGHEMCDEAGVAGDGEAEEGVGTYDAVVLRPMREAVARVGRGLQDAGGIGVIRRLGAEHGAAFLGLGGGRDGVLRGGDGRLAGDDPVGVVAGGREIVDVDVVVVDGDGGAVPAVGARGDVAGVHVGEIDGHGRACRPRASGIGVIAFSAASWAAAATATACAGLGGEAATDGDIGVV